MMKEVFRPIPGYEGKYEISNRRRVKSLGRIVKRCHGRIRTITERYILSDRDTICLGSGSLGGDTHDPLKLMVSAFHREYTPSKYNIVCTCDKSDAQLSDITLVPKLKYKSKCHHKN